MAKKSRNDQSLDELKREIARSRDRVGHDLFVIRRELDFPRRIKRSFQQQTVAWVTAAVVVGALVVFLPMRRKKVYVEPKLNKKERKNKLLEAGFALGALKFAATILRPVVVSFITKKMRGYMDEAHSAKHGSLI
jgi:hypothetical protein